jgi:hypothetical protein
VITKNLKEGLRAPMHAAMALRPDTKLQHGWLLQARSRSRQWSSRFNTTDFIKVIFLFYRRQTMAYGAGASK